MISYLPLLQQLEFQQTEMLDLLESWVNINSGSENLEGLAAMINALSSAFAVLDGNLRKVDLPGYQKIDSKGNINEAKVGQALVISKHPDAPIHIFLGGHMDTVYPLAHSFQKAKKIDQDLFQGPGAADMKGGLVILLKALEILEKSPLAGKIGWEVLINPDEEIGSPASESLFTEAAKRNRIGLLFEPTYPDGSIVNERKGSLNFTIIAKGKPAHAGRDFFKGRNAIIALSRFMTAAAALTNQYLGITVNVGFVEGGGPVNIVPDLAVCKLNIRVMRPQDVQLIKDSIQQIVNGCCEPDGATLTLHPQVSRPPKPFDEKNKVLFGLVKEHAASMGIQLNWQPSGGVCDGNLLAAAGLPTVDTLGVVGGNIHTSEEYMLINSLTERSKLAASFLLKIAAGEIVI